MIKEDRRMKALKWRDYATAVCCGTPMAGKWLWYTGGLGSAREEHQKSATTAPLQTYLMVAAEQGDFHRYLYLQNEDRFQKQPFYKAFNVL